MYVCHTTKIFQEEYITMILAQKPTVKNIVAAAFGFLSALFAILALTFTIASAKASVMGMSKIEESASGFGWMFGDDTGADYWETSAGAGVLCVFTFILALATIAAFVYFIATAKTEAAFRKGMLVVCAAACVTTLFFMIAGFIAVGAVEDEITKSLGSYAKYVIIDYSTAAFVPFILTVLFAGGAVAAEKCIKEAPVAEEAPAAEETTEA